jgi:hypothetical protein
MIQKDSAFQSQAYSRVYSRFFRRLGSVPKNKKFDLTLRLYTWEGRGDLSNNGKARRVPMCSQMQRCATMCVVVAGSIERVVGSINLRRLTTSKDFAWEKLAIFMLVEPGAFDVEQANAGKL